jgi:hypothetical protein
MSTTSRAATRPEQVSVDLAAAMVVVVGSD